MSQLKKALEKAKEARAGLFAGLVEGAEGGQAEKGERGGFVTDDFEYTCTPVVAVPDALLLNNRIVAVNERNPASEQFKLLRTQLFKLTRDHGRNTIQVTGCGSGDGASLVSLNLAVSIAQDTRQTTLLVDVNFRRPAIGGLLGLGSDHPGLRSYFMNDVPLEGLFVCPGIKKLTVLVAGGRVNNPSELLGSPKMEELVREWKKRYADRYVIFDTPGIAECPDPLVVAEYVDGIILVARANHTSRDSIKSAVALLPQDKLLGVVMNDLPPDELNG